MPFIVTCLPGVASLLASELTRLNLTPVPLHAAAVSVGEDHGAALQALLRSRLAERVLWPLVQVPVPPGEAAEALARGVDWTAHDSRSGRLHVHVDHGRGVPGDHRMTRKIFLRHAPRHLIPVDQPHGALCLRLTVEAEQATLYLDLAGEGLQKRGYRLEGGHAPLRETLAAALLEAAQWPLRLQQGEHLTLVDPFCGSGTLLLEAAWMACERAPTRARHEFAYRHWAQADVALLERLKADTLTEERSAPEGLVLKGFDADGAVISQARANAERAGMDGTIHFERRELGALRARDLQGARQETAGLVVTNPPWGERLEEQEVAQWLYAALGEQMARHVPGWQAVVVGGRVEALDRTGMQAEAHWKIRNGPLQVYVRRMTPVRRASVAALRVEGEPAFEVPEPAQALYNRLRKNSRQLRKWLQQSGVECYRLYDRDLPEFNVSIDIYGERVLVQEYAPPRTIDPDAAQRRRTWAVTAVRAALGVHREQVFLRTRAQQKGRGQYQKLDEAQELFVVREGAARLLVNLKDYLDTGLFLDHRPMRLRLAEEAQGKRFLNLFAYTGTATVHAALGGARQSVTVDASRRYLNWAASNLAVNGLSTRQHELVRADVRQWVRDNRETFDLMFCDPPTFSNNKQRDDFAVQDDHAELIHALMTRLAQDGVLYFSCNFRRFELDPSLQRAYRVEDISRWSLPPDFQRNDRIHYCFRISHGD